MSQNYQRLIQACAFAGCLTPLSLHAQVVPDSTLPDNSVITPDGQTLQIDGGTTRESNLFHSFQDFSVPTGNTAFFNNAESIANIFSRVTGGNISNIDGLISANGTANLFLINPAGIIFGENAQLNLGGSFFGSTADSIVFNDGEFSATDLDNPPLLTVNAPIGLGFRDNPAPIEVNSIASGDFNPEPSFDDNFFGLRVPDGKTFALAGGNITANSGGLLAVGGRIEFGAVAAAGNIGLNLEGDKISLDIPESLRLADISLVNGAGFLVAGAGDGDIKFSANNIEISDNSGLFAGIFPELGNPESQAGNISVNATNSISIENFSSIRNDVGNSFSIATGNSGDITIITSNLEVNNSGISASTFGLGNSGDISITAENSVEINGERPNTRNGSGSPGGIFAQVDLGGEGNAGNLTIETETLSISDGAKVQVGSFGIGNAGNLEIKANLVEIFNTPIFSDFTTGIFAALSIDPNTVDLPEGEAGNITIDTNQLRVIDGGKISVSSEGIGNAGNLSINARESILVRGVDPEPEDGVSFIRANVGEDATGIGGDINLVTGQLEINEAGEISVSSESGRGGNVNLRIDQNLTLRDNALISAEAFNSADGGNVIIDANFITAFPNQTPGNGSDIIASAGAAGTGGRINLTADGVFGLEVQTPRNNSNDIDASGGTNGVITIDTADVDVTKGIIEFPQNVVDSEETVAQVCRNGDFGDASFVVRGKGGIPASPAEPLNSGALLNDGSVAASAAATPQAIQVGDKEILLARGIVKDENGKVSLTAYSTSENAPRYPAGVNCPASNLG